MKVLLADAATPYAASIVVYTSIRVSNTKAKTELGWCPMFPAYREGIRAMVSPAPAGSATVDGLARNSR